MSHQAGEERLHHGQVHRETFRQEEVSRHDVTAAHAVRRGEGPRHLLPHPGVRRGRRPHGAHSSGQRTCQSLSSSLCVLHRYLSNLEALLRPPSSLSVRTFHIPKVSFLWNLCTCFIFCCSRNKGRRLFISQSDWWIGRLFILLTSSLRTGKQSNQTTATRLHFA